MSNNEQQFCERNVTMDQLPDPVFREIFKYLDDKTILFKLRDVCIRIREQVDNYIPIKGIFMITGEDNFPSKIIYTFQRVGKEIDGHLELGPGCPIPIYYAIKVANTHPQKRSEHNFDCKVPFFTFNSSCFTFDYKSKSWIPIQEDIPLCNETSNHNIQLISNPELFEFYTVTSKGPASTDLYYVPSYMSLKVRYLRSERRENGSYLIRSQCIYSIDLPPHLKNLRYFTLIRCSPLEIILVGGTYIRPYKNFSDQIESQNNYIWHGKFSADGRDMIWSTPNEDEWLGWDLQTHQPL